MPLTSRLLKSLTSWSTELFTGVEGGDPAAEPVAWHPAEVVTLPGDEAFGRKVSSSAIPTTTKTTIAAARAEIASLLRGLRAACLKLANVKQPLLVSILAGQY
jgi:hypothetical protein